jgi:hypothetical protein
VRTERIVEAGERRLRMTAETTLDPARRAMRIVEGYAGDGGPDRSCVFTMRCFTAGELRELAVAAGFASVDVRAGEQAGAAADRLVLVARR